MTFANRHRRAGIGFHPPNTLQVTQLTAQPEGGRTLLQSPDAQRVGNITLIGYESGDGYPSVARVHHDTGDVDIVRMGSNSNLDDHDSPAILLRSNGQVVAAWSHHDANAFIAVSGDVGETWSTPVQLSSGDFTYARLFEVAGTLHLYYRDGDAGSGNTVEFTSTNGISWSGPNAIATGSTYMAMYHGSRLDITRRLDPWSGVTHTVRHAYREDDGSWHKTDGTGITAPFAGADMTLVYQVAGRRPIVYDVGEDLILFLTGTNATLPNLNDRKFHLASWDGSSWNVEDIVSVGNGSIVYNGAALVDATSVYLARGVSGVAQIFRYDKVGGTWQATQITTGSVHQFRPFIPRDASSSLPVCWDYGVWTDYDNFDIGISGLTVWG